MKKVAIVDRRHFMLHAGIGMGFAGAAFASYGAPGKVHTEPSGIHLHALLVGVSSIPALPNFAKLPGVSADIGAMVDLVKRLGTPPENTAVLSDAFPSAVHPTLNNILAALDHLEAQSDKDMRALIYLSGHGSQQPIFTSASGVGNEIDGLEIDGLDEIFLCADARAFNPNDHTPGALTDNMFSKRLQSILKKGAQVWLVVDSCHAGSFSRNGAAAEFGRSPYRIVGYRGGPPSMLGVPTWSAAWTRLLARGSEDRREISVLFAPPQADTEPSPWSNLVAFYATPASEQAVEVKASNSQSVMGLFTLLLTEEANRLLASSGRGVGIDYRLLMQRVMARYRKHAPAGVPLPSFEGVTKAAWFTRPVP
jgi:hypothetical protein